MIRYHHGGWGPGAWIAVAFVMVVFWAAVVTAIVFAMRGTHHQPTGAAPTTSDARRILDERFARGEIDADEYQQRRDLLRGN